ncbi:MAG: hypothetical protein R3B70_08930 [Polyangiaceae bacterium]
MRNAKPLPEPTPHLLAQSAVFHQNRQLGRAPDGEELLDILIPEIIAGQIQVAQAVKARAPREQRQSVFCDTAGVHADGTERREQLGIEQVSEHLINPRDAGELQGLKALRFSGSQEREHVPPGERVRPKAERGQVSQEAVDRQRLQILCTSIVAAHSKDPHDAGRAELPHGRRKRI